MNKEQRTLKFWLRQQRAQVKRRNLGRKRQRSAEGMSKAEFERRFPGVPLKVWYERRSLNGESSAIEDTRWAEIMADFEQCDGTCCGYCHCDQLEDWS